MTSMMLQYLEIKEQYKDFILFYRLGDFYEMFFNDAITASRELELTLTGRDCGEPERAPMCGVPYHSVEPYIGKLISKGYKVAICEQMENPAETKGIVKREVVREITPGTVVEASLLNETKNNYLCSLFFQRGSVGVTFADISTGEMSTTLIEGEPSRILNELGTYAPREIITNIDSENGAFLTNFAKEKLGALVEFSMYDYFNSDKCRARVTSQFGEDFANKSLNDTGIVHSVGAILEYIIKTQKTDISYIKLYIQEIVTADNDTDVKKSLSDLIQIAKVSFDNPVGKVYMARIISDFCMIHKLECPTPELFDILKSLVFEHIADEFFLGLTDSNRHVYAPIAIDYISIYNYKKSKFYESDNIAIFDRHIHAAIHSIFANDESFGEITSHASGIFSTKLSDRKLFDGRVEFCAPSARILVSYFPVNCIAGVVTDAIRYAENKLRALMGIKTSLAVGELSPKITSVIDEYFSSVSFEFTTYKTASKEKAEKRSEEQYNHLYDIPRHKLSLSNARVIEQTSWQTTKKLTEAFTDNENIVGAIHESPAKPAECQAQNADVSAECRMQSAELNISAECRVQSAELQLNEDSSLGQKSTSTLHSKWGSHHAFLLICLNGTHAEQRNYAKSFGMTLDELADNINDIAVNLIGDIILDFDGDKYTVIPDYIDVIEEKNI